MVHTQKIEKGEGPPSGHPVLFLIATMVINSLGIFRNIYTHTDKYNYMLLLFFSLSHVVQRDGLLIPSCHHITLSCVPLS